MFFQNYFFKSCKEQKLYIKILGTQVDYKLGEEVIHEINNLKFHQNKRIIFENKCGETSFSESLIYIAKSKQFIGIDSGLLHFARLLGIESWSIWGPTAPHTRLRPINGFKDHILYKPVFCSLVFMLQKHHLVKVIISVLKVFLMIKMKAPYFSFGLWFTICLYQSIYYI